MNLPQQYNVLDNTILIFKKSYAIPSALIQKTGISLINFEIDHNEKKAFITEVLKKYKKESTQYNSIKGLSTIKKLDAIRDTIKKPLNLVDMGIIVQLNLYKMEILDNLFYDFKQSHQIIYNKKGYTHSKYLFVDKIIKKTNKYIKTFKE